VESARVSRPQVDLTRYGLDKTSTLLILRCLGATRSAEERVHLLPGGKVLSSDARPRWQSRGEAEHGQKVATTSLPARGRGVGRPSQRGRNNAQKERSCPPAAGELFTSLCLSHSWGQRVWGRRGALGPEAGGGWGIGRGRRCPIQGFPLVRLLFPQAC